jgi:ClpP class serine protease
MPRFFAMERRAFMEYAAKRQAILSRFDGAVDKKAIQDLWGGGEDEPNDETPGYTLDDSGAAHIPVSGILVKAPDWVDKILAEHYGVPFPCTYQGICNAMARAEMDDAVTRIIFDVDSPGGVVDGVDKAAQAIRALKKPCEARIDYMAASAAFWLASQTGKITATTPVASVGSIGLVMVLYDWSKAMEDYGIAQVVITSTDAPDKCPDIKTDEGIATLRKELDSVHAVFAERVASGRRCSIEKVNTEFGRGGLVFARDAVKVGMIDALDEGPFTPSTEDFTDQGDSPDRTDNGEDGAVGASAAAQAAQSQGGEGNMPEDTKALEAAAMKAGVEAEKKRVAALTKWKAADPENEKLAQIVDEAIATDKTAEDVMPQIHVAIRDFAKQAGGGAALPAGQENPPRVRTATSAGAAVGGEVEDDASSWSEATIQAKGKKIAAAIKGTGADNGIDIRESIRFRE